MQLEILHSEPIVPAALKMCPRCEEALPLSSFGRNQYYEHCGAKDGLSLYCKICTNLSVARHRQRLREYKNIRTKKSVPDRPSFDSTFSPRRIARMLRKLSPTDRVREAIRLGARTQKEIAEVTRLPKDEVCDALATLLLWTREIRTEVNGARMYFINEDGAAAPKHSFPAPIEPRSHGVSTIYSDGEPAIVRGGRR